MPNTRNLPTSLFHRSRLKLSLDLKLIGGIVILGAVGAFVGLAGWKGLLDQRASRDRSANLSNDALDLTRAHNQFLRWIQKVNAQLAPASIDGVNAVLPAEDSLQSWLQGPSRSRLEVVAPNCRTPMQTLETEASALRESLVQAARPEQKTTAIEVTQLRAQVMLRTMRIGEAFDQLDHELRVVYGALLASSEQGMKQALWMTWAGMGFGAVVDGWVALMILRLVSRPVLRITHLLAEGASRVGTAADLVSATSHALAVRTSEQAAGLRETETSLAQLGGTTRRNSITAKQVGDLSKLAMDAAEHGAQEMRALDAAMVGIKTASDEVSTIVHGIDAIAFQTNLLALNAAVEAARAGNAGLGFAVVADEVRSLAQRSAKAAKQTESQIESALERTQQGVEICTRVAGQLDTIVGRIRELHAAIGGVARASSEQDQGFEQVKVAMSDIDRATQANAASAEEGAAAAEELTAETRRLNTIIDDLCEMVQGSGPRDAGSPTHSSALLIPAASMAARPGPASLANDGMRTPVRSPQQKLELVVTG
ncbi:MAG: hypothetical protein JNK85_17840 [Verrucomicrobiales bacterium]|nr:hypothetical protein [Verrucomicrobiales bacterium]